MEIKLFDNWSGVMHDSGIKHRLSAYEVFSMDANDHLRKTLDYYRQQRQQKIADMRPQLEQLRSLELMIRQLERELGEAPASAELSEVPLALSDNFTMADSLATNNRSSAPVSVRPDEFFTMTQSEAAKAYLKKVGHAISFDELVAALRRGGAQLGGADPKRTLYVSLARNPNKEFVWPSTDHIGLSDFYGGRARAAALPGNRNGKKKKKRGRKPGRRAKVATAAAEAPAGGKKVKKEKKPTEVAAALQEIMSDGKSRSKNDIVTEIAAKLGHPVAPIAVFGTLYNSGKYAEKDGQYVAVQ
jgi:hypothetical protein